MSFNGIWLQVFDAYAQFEESMINTKMESTAEEETDEDGKLQRYVEINCRQKRKVLIESFFKKKLNKNFLPQRNKLWNNLP